MNRKDSINIGHWNSRGSFLGHSTLGILKLNNIERYLGKYNIVILGISEANIYNTQNEVYQRISGYDIIKLRDICLKYMFIFEIV